MPRIFTFSIHKRPDDSGPAWFQFHPVEPVLEKLLDDALSVRREFERTNVDIWLLLKRSNQLSEYETYLGRLQEALTAAVDSDLPGFAIPLQVLSQIREEFLKIYGEKLRSDYIRQLTWIVLTAGIVAFVYGAFLSGPMSEKIQKTMEAQIRTAAWGVFGVCAAVWLSSVIRNRQLEWSNLTALDPDRFSPMIRLGFTMVVTYIFAILVKINAISFGVGKVNLATFVEQPSVAILVGIIGGLGGDAIVDAVIGRVRGLAKPASI